MIRRLQVVIACAVLALFGAAAGPQAARAATAHITITNMTYTGDLHVQPGELVEVVDNDPFNHTLTDKRTHLFDTGIIPANGGMRSFTAPSRAGRYPFGCRIHPAMAGTLTVGNPPDVSHLTTSRSATIPPGAAHRLQTTLTDATTGRVLAGLRVVLQKRTGTSGSFAVLAGVVTNSAGVATATVHPRVRTQYRWHFAGTPRHAPATSGVATISMR